VGLIAVNKGGCWGCAYEATCACSDGAPLTCKKMEPVCAPGQEIAIINGCYECVEPQDCKIVPCDGTAPTCTEEQNAIDSDDVVFVDQSVCTIAVDCLPGYIGVDTNGAGYVGNCG